MKSSAVILFTVAILARTALVGTPILASDMLKHSGPQAASGAQNSDSRVTQRGQPSRELLTALAVWLSAEFRLSIDTPPSIKFVPPERLSVLRFRGVPSDHLGDARDVVAVYDDDAQTVYLPRGWTGRTAAETSILIHEMVHHAQNLGGMKFECPQAREKVAYEAQQRWLEQFGSDLAKEFEIDGFTLLVLTNCGL